jgi:hypothetical protein
MAPFPVFLRGVFSRPAAWDAADFSASFWILPPSGPEAPRIFGNFPEDFASEWTANFENLIKHISSDEITYINKGYFD